MKDRYPYLFAWKKFGFNKKQQRFEGMPNHPPLPVDQREEDAYLERMEARFKEWGFTRNDIDTIKEALKENPVTAAYKQVKEKLVPEAMAAGFRVLNIQGEYRNKRYPREEAVRRLANMFLAPSQGGSNVPDKEAREILRIAYEEMCNSIKEVRKKLDIPLSGKDGANVWPSAETPEDILTAVPDLLLLFDQSELPLLIEQPSVRDTSLKIMHERLKSLFPPSFTAQSLKKILYK